MGKMGFKYKSKGGIGSRYIEPLRRGWREVAGKYYCGRENRGSMFRETYNNLEGKLNIKGSLFKMTLNCKVKNTVAWKRGVLRMYNDTFIVNTCALEQNKIIYETYNYKYLPLFVTNIWFNYVRIS